MSEKRLLGWEPTEVHEHEYDAGGKLVRTIVTRETEWDDLERAKFEGLSIYESRLCECGLHESVAQSDPDMEIELPICPVCAGLQKQLRILGDKDDRALKALGENPPSSAALPSDGRRIYLRPKVSSDDSDA